MQGDRRHRGISQAARVSGVRFRDQRFEQRFIRRVDLADHGEIEALLRRQNISPKEDHTIIFDDLKLDTWSNLAERGGHQISLTAKEYTLLELFMRNPNKVLSREYIAEQVWDIDFDTGTNFIDVYVNYLRKKIEKGFNKKLIHTVIGMGYTMRNDR